MKSRMFIVVGLLSFSVLLYPSGMDNVTCLKQGLRIGWNRETALLSGGALGLLAMGTWWLYSRSNKKRSTTAAAPVQTTVTSTGSVALAEDRDRNVEGVTTERVQKLLYSGVVEGFRERSNRVQLRDVAAEDTSIIIVDYSTADDTISDLKNAIAVRRKIDVARITAIFAIDGKGNRILLDDAAKAYGSFYQQEEGLSRRLGEIHISKILAPAASAQAAATATGSAALAGAGSEVAVGSSTMRFVRTKRAQDLRTRNIPGGRREVTLHVGGQDIGSIRIDYSWSHDTILDLKNVVARELKVDVASITILALDENFDKNNKLISFEDDEARVHTSFPFQGETSLKLGRVRIAPPVQAAAAAPTGPAAAAGVGASA